MTAPVNAPAATSSASATTSPKTIAATVKNMAGMLWDEMLSELNQTGFSSGALGTGGDDFQSMFLWNIAQNDFGKYDSQLTNAAINQLDGGNAAAAAAPAGAMASIPASVSSSLPSTGMPASGAIAALFATANAGAMSAGAAQAGAPLATAPAASGAAASSSGNADVSGPVLNRAVAYAQQLWPQISAAAQTLSVSPVAILAQSALETGWGAAAAGNNFFGIKAAPGDAATSRPTHEMVNGVLQAQTASFRDYASPSASVDDYVGVIQSGFQSAIGQNSVAGFAQTLQNNGYATDQNYAAKIISIAQSPLMQQVLATLPGQSSAPSSE